MYHHGSQTLFPELNRLLSKYPFLLLLFGDRVLVIVALAALELTV